MLKAKDIIKQARYTLSDTAVERWSDDRLLALLDEGIKDIALKTILMVEYFYVPIADNVVDYDFSPVATKIVRIEYLDKPVPLVSYEEMDKLNPSWQTDDPKSGGVPEAFIYNHHKRACIKQYPAITNSYNPYITYNQPYGVVTDIEYSDIQPVLANHYGDIANIPPAGYFKVFHVRRHADVTDMNDDLYIDDLCKQPLHHYVAGRALRDNQDTQNREMGSEELNLYSVLIEQFSLEKEKNFARPKRSTTYNPMGT